MFFTELSAKLLKRTMISCQTDSYGILFLTNIPLNIVSHKRFYLFRSQSPIQGLPYIPRVHLSEGSLVRSSLKWLWSEEPMVRRSFIPKSLYSESCYRPKIPYSERPSTIWILCYEDSLVRSSSSPRGAMLRTSIFRKSPSPIRVLYYECPLV